jgi:hypothetical protein
MGGQWKSLPVEKAEGYYREALALAGPSPSGSIEPLRSANRIMTCLRSPSNALLERGSVPTGCAHSGQNFGLVFESRLDTSLISCLDR